MSGEISIGAAIKRAMECRGVVGVELAAQIGVRPATLSDYRRGATIPSSVVVAALADALDWPSLIDIGARYRVRTCATCGREFSAENTKKQYCSIKCSRTMWARIKRGDRQQKIRVFQSRLELHEASVRAFCYGCAADRICPDSKCSLRPVSPLPLPFQANSRRVHTTYLRREA